MAETTWTLPDINSIAEKATEQVAYEYRFVGLTGDAPRVTPAMARIVLEQAGVQPADRDRLAARVRELEAALTAFVEAEDINRQYDGTYDSPPGHVVAEMYERAAAMARAALADSGPGGEEA